MTTDKQNPNEIAEQLLAKTDGEELVLHLDGETELPASIIRPLHLPRSTRDDVDGGSLRYAVQASEQAIGEFDLPGQEGLIAAEQVESGSWNRSRVEFYEPIPRTDDEGNEFADFGDLVRSDEIVAVDDGDGSD